MAIPGELDTHKNCPDCGSPMPIEVLMSGAGYYIGQSCKQCGPWCRLSHYYRTRDEAQHALDTNTIKMRDTDYHGGRI